MPQNDTHLQTPLHHNTSPTNHETSTPPIVNTQPNASINTPTYQDQLQQIRKQMIEDLQLDTTQKQYDTVNESIIQHTTKLQEVKQSISKLKEQELIDKQTILKQIEDIKAELTKLTATFQKKQADLLDILNSHLADKQQVTEKFAKLVEELQNKQSLHLTEVRNLRTQKNDILRQLNEKITQTITDVELKRLLNQVASPDKYPILKTPRRARKP